VQPLSQLVQNGVLPGVGLVQGLAQNPLVQDFASIGTGLTGFRANFGGLP
jgi:hypothetical protein